MLRRGADTVARCPTEALRASAVPSTPQSDASYGEVHDAPAFVRQHQKHVQDLEPDRGHREEVYRNQRRETIPQECPPRLRWRFSAFDHILGDASLANVDAKLEQFAVNAWRSPERVFSAQGQDEFPDCSGDGWAVCFAATNLPVPEQAEGMAMPADNGGGLDDGQSCLPMVPNRAQPSPQEPVSDGQLRTFDGALQDADLMAQGEDLELKRSSAPERRDGKGDGGSENGTETETSNKRQLPIYQLHRSLRQPQGKIVNPSRIK